MQQQTSSDTAHPVTPYLATRFRELIHAFIDAGLPKSAVFYAERYFALDNRHHDALHLYSKSLLSCGQVHSALWFVRLPYQPEPCPGCYIAQGECYTALGQHAQAGEALEASLRDRTHAYFKTNRETCTISNEAVLLCKMGKAALKANLLDKAIRNFRRALSLNPMIWDAFEGLCAAGSFPEIEEIFPSRPAPVKPSFEDLRATFASSSKQNGPLASGLGFFTPAGSQPNPPRGAKAEPARPQPFRIGMPFFGQDSMAFNESFNADNSILAPLRPAKAPATTVPPRPLSSSDETGPAQKKPRSQTRQQPPAEKEKGRHVAGADTRLKKACSRPVLVSSNPISSKPSLPLRNPSAAANQKPAATRNGRSEVNAMGPPLASRRSARLLSNSAAGEKLKSHNVKHPPARKRAGHGRTKSAESDMDEDHPPITDVAASPSPHSNNALSPRSDEIPAPVWTEEMEQAAQKAYNTAVADNYVYDLMRLFATCLRLLSTYDIQAFLTMIDQLPLNHQQTATAIIMIARVRYEQADYMTAERFFDSARKLDPHRVLDMDLFSTTLWHLQKNAKLSFLAQELLSIDANSPQAWIAAGNCFSLQKERSQALACFRRAIQLDPTCAYAHALSGHELTDEDLEKAISFFQSSLRIDQRSYNAWYGLGSCYLRMSKLRLAEYHFRKAVSIHPQNAVLLGCLGMVLERLDKGHTAYQLYSQAVKLNQDNALVRYRRARMLIEAKKYREAIKDLEYLRDSAPEEVNVVFQLARVYRLVGDESKSAQMLAVARDMSPKSMNKIKRLLAIDPEGDSSMDEG